MRIIGTIMLMSFAIVGSGFKPFPTAHAQEPITIDEIVVTASRMAQHNYKVASDVTVITAEDLKDMRAQHVADALEGQPGINITDNGSAKTATIDIRGFGDTATRNVLVLVNDRKVNPIDISGPDLLQIPIDSIERIEVIRGAGSVLYGDNAVGGVVNIITKEGRGDLHGKVGAEYGSYDARGIDAEVSGDIHDLSYYLYSQYYQTGGYRENNDLLTRDLTQRYGYRFTDKLKVSLNTSWHEDIYGLPGGLNFAELETLGRRGSADTSDKASSKDRFIQATFDITPWPEDTEWGHFVLDTSYRNRDSYAVFYSFGEFATKRELDTYGVNAKYVFDQELWDRDVNFVTGLDYYDTDNDITGSGTNSDDLTISKQEIGGYVFAEVEAVDRVYVNAGTRRQQAEYTFDQVSGTPVYTTNKPEEWVSMGGMKYEYAPKSNVFANVQQTFRFLATDEWYDSFNGVLDTTLDQQTGIQYEAGVKHNFDDVLVVSVTPYLLDIENEIFFDPTGGSFGFGANSNYDETRRMGIELGQTLDVLRLIECEALDGLELFANYTYQEAEFHDGPNDGKRIPMVARHQASGGAKLKFLDHFLLSLTGRYVGERYAINDTANATPPVKPYFVVDGQLAYSREQFEVFLNVNNIFNELYYTYVSKSSFSNNKDHFPAPEANFNFGVNVKF